MSTIPEYRKRLFESQERQVRIMHEDWTEEQIKERCNELQFRIVDAEENRPLAEKFQKIWNSKVKPR
jgi:pimeloyl-CoA synthetase